MQDPPYGMSDSIGILTGHNKAGNRMVPLKSVEQAELDKIAVDSQKILMLQRAKNASFISGNKRRDYRKDQVYNRWVGSSINFNEPELEKIQVKLSKEHMRNYGQHRGDQSGSVDFWKKIENPNDVRFRSKMSAKEEKYLQVDSNRRVGLSKSPVEVAD